MSVPTRVLLVATILVVATLLVFSATVYNDLPARIPTHFNAAGTPAWLVAHGHAAVGIDTLFGL